MSDLKPLSTTTEDNFGALLKDRLEGLNFGLGVLEHVNVARSQLGDLGRYLFLLRVEPMSDKARDRDYRWFVFGIGRQAERVEEAFRIRYDGSDHVIVSAPGHEESGHMIGNKFSKYILTILVNNLDILTNLYAEDKGADACGVERFVARVDPA